MSIRWFMAAAVAVGAAAALSACGSATAELKAAPIAVNAAPSTGPDWMARYPEQFPLQVAVFLTSHDNNVFGLIHALEEMGIPFFCTRDLNQALGHRSVIVYPSVEGQSVTLAQADDLARFVQDGGTVFAQNVFWGPLKPVFGFHGFTASRQHHWLRFTPPDDVLRYLDRPQELSVRLGDEHIPEIFWTNAFEPDPKAQVLARYEDGSAALIANAFGKGKAYLSGVSLEDAVARNQANRDYEAQRSYVNSFEPGADVWLLLLRAWYESSAPQSVRLATIPRGARSVLLLSHDVDSVPGLQGANLYTAMEKRRGLRSTLFLQTKFAENALGPALWTKELLPLLHAIAADGFDVESHSVVHAMSFNRFPLGTGQETLASYRPTVDRDATTYRNGSVFGELIVSKSLLDGELPGHSTVFFRAGHLRVPPGLPEAELRLGYEFDSSFTAPDVLSNFPYHLALGLQMDRESPILEFPVTFEDEESPGLAGHVSTDLDVLQANADNGAINVLLVHTNDPAHKVPVEEEILNRLPPGIEVSDLLSFARYWQARERLKWRVEAVAAGELQLTVTAPVAIDGATFEVNSPVSEATGVPGLKIQGQKLVLPALSAGQTVTLRIRCGN